MGIRLMSRRKKQPIVHIFNPLPESSQYTSMRRAKRLVASGRARFLWHREIEIYTARPTRERELIQREIKLLHSRDPDRYDYSDLVDWRGHRPPSDERKRGKWVIPPGKVVS